LCSDPASENSAGPFLIWQFPSFSFPNPVVKLGSCNSRQLVEGSWDSSSRDVLQHVIQPRGELKPCSQGGTNFLGNIYIASLEVLRVCSRAVWIWGGASCTELGDGCWCVALGLAQSPKYRKIWKCGREGRSHWEWF